MIVSTQIQRERYVKPILRKRLGAQKGYPPAEWIIRFLPELPVSSGQRYSGDLEIHMDFQEIWREQCEVTPAIRERFGVKSALDYLVGEKFLNLPRPQTKTLILLPNPRAFKPWYGRFSTLMNSEAM
jgi:hypothetical protein